jgi:hypothetical protein
MRFSQGRIPMSQFHQRPQSTATALNHSACGLLSQILPRHFSTGNRSSGQFDPRVACLHFGGTYGSDRPRCRHFWYESKTVDRTTSCEKLLQQVAHEYLAPLAIDLPKVVPVAPSAIGLEPLLHDRLRSGRKPKLAHLDDSSQLRRTRLPPRQRAIPQLVREAGAPASLHGQPGSLLNPVPPCPPALLCHLGGRCAMGRLIHVTHHAQGSQSRAQGELRNLLVYAVQDTL